VRSKGAVVGYVGGPTPASDWALLIAKSVRTVASSFELCGRLSSFTGGTYDDVEGTGFSPVLKNSKGHNVETVFVKAAWC
jgi:hypothetical protein